MPREAGKKSLWWRYCLCTAHHTISWYATPWVLRFMVSRLLLALGHQYLDYIVCFMTGHPWFTQPRPAVPPVSFTAVPKHIWWHFSSYSRQCRLLLWFSSILACCKELEVEKEGLIMLLMDYESSSLERRERHSGKDIIQSAFHWRVEWWLEG